MKVYDIYIQNSSSQGDKNALEESQPSSPLNVINYISLRAMLRI